MVEGNDLPSKQRGLGRGRRSPCQEVLVHKAATEHAPPLIRSVAYRRAWTRRWPVPARSERNDEGAAKEDGGLSAAGDTVEAVQAGFMAGLRARWTLSFAWGIRAPQGGVRT